MQKVIKIGNTTIVVLEDATTYQKDNLTEEELNTVMNSDDTEEIVAIMCPEYSVKIKERNTIIDLIERVQKSKILSTKEDSVYWNEVSELSIPKELVQAILEAEQAGDAIKIETYKNFWTLMSLNPDEQCRLNLFWFLNRNGLVISKSGMFVAYRNVCFFQNDADGNPIYTDEHSHTFRIQMGKMVTMPREKCDNRQDVTCSRGLHLGARTWLKENYFGNVGLVCLCNPADVVAVPHEDYYGKLRTCAYLPIDFAQFDENGDVIPYNVENGFDCQYVPKIIYEGLTNTESDNNYRLIIPELEGVNRAVITNRLLEMAKDSLLNRVVE